MDGWPLLYSVALDGVDGGGRQQWDEKYPAGGGDLIFIQPSDFPIRDRQP